ncbi:Vms1/Ankzf1 family peptidyl-tRNA hydrolase [Streptomyces sp. KN37]|uniref:baeRF2 domain-containing protein n=1 Tax=Streptomyces sp. KN37 TaxID=3090667 RepID=UPI002A75BC9E|nr:Vms1/Ankzf1 family peptidyl-tRNA hydrolase [Streptomyces sp. KN37]WPO75424.1 Vms1/Ankzf1 family peptidyl-tRNA hydrolase [Streptomyces sp. KN37]
MQLSFLEPLFDRSGPWATVYFDPGQNDESGAKRHELSVREVCRTLEEQGADPTTTKAVREVLTSTATADYPAGRALFAAAGEVVLTRRLSRAPQGQIACWSPLPRLAPLLELSGQDPVCLVAYIDRTGADFESRGAGGPRDVGGVEGQQWPIHRTSTSDWSERHFQLKVENTWEHNAGEIAEALATAYEESGAEVVVLVGDPRERSSVRERLPEAVREVTVETEHGGRAAGSDSPALEEAIERARRECADRRVGVALDRFRAGRVGTDRPTDAVEGVPAVVEAAREHRIDTLLLRPGGPDLDRETWVGTDPDQVAVRRGDARTLGESAPVSVRADDALLRSAAVTGAEVLIVPLPDDEPSLSGDADPAATTAKNGTGRAGNTTGTADTDVPVGGIGALLRWTYQPTS